jgi:hypothetical protein
MKEILSEEDKEYYIALGLMSEVLDEIEEFIIDCDVGGKIFIEKTEEGLKVDFANKED